MSIRLESGENDTLGSRPAAEYLDALEIELAVDRPLADTDGEVDPDLLLAEDGEGALSDALKTVAGEAVTLTTAMGALGAMGMVAMARGDKAKEKFEQKKAIQKKNEGTSARLAGGQITKKEARDEMKANAKEVKDPKNEGKAT